MKKNYLITLDVDGTLIDNYYRTTSPTINSVISQLRSEGNVFLINSNRALEDILPTANAFGIEGPIIGENGCFIYNQESGETQVLIGDETSRDLENLNQQIPKIIKDNFPDSMFIIADTSDLNKNLDALDIPAGTNYIFMMNEFRKHTMSIHVKRIEGDKFIRDIDKAIEFSIAITKYINDNNLNLFSCHTANYANVLVYPLETNKSKGFSALAKNYPNFIKIFIGDDADDKPLSSEADYFFAVNNATNDAKEIADYVAREKVTKGTEEILLKIDELVK